MHLGSLTPLQTLGIPVALIGSLLLALGAELQHRGVRRSARPRGGPRIAAVLALVRDRAWLAGTALLVLAVPFQLLSLFLAPLTVVQPLGVAALVLSALLDARGSHRRLDGATARSVALCVLGVGVFVTVAAATTASLPVRDAQLLAVLGVLALVLVLLAPAVLLLRRRMPPIVLVLCAGLLFGFVGTLTKVVVDRLHTIWALGTGLTATDWLTGLCVVGMGAAGLLGSVLVQTAYATGPPHLVVAGLTVIDPVVGVTIGVVILGEAADAPPWALPVFAVSGALAVAGVLGLARRAASTAVEPAR